MSALKSSIHPVARGRASRGWSQAELALRANVSRASVSAIEGNRLSPSVAAALALAQALESSVEELFGTSQSATQISAAQWAWRPASEPCRYWEADIGGRRVLYPVEGPSFNVVPHDGLWYNGLGHSGLGHDGFGQEGGSSMAGSTLVLACCDPAVGLLATEYARASGFRLLVFPRGGTAALELLKSGLVHLAGIHRSTTEQPARNADSARALLGDGYSLVRVAHWQEGVALSADDRTRSIRSVARRDWRWAMREKGSGARECLDALLGDKSACGRLVRSHTAVAEAVRAGWADAGVCVQLAADEAGLNFIPVQTETLDFCFATPKSHDPRVQALIRLLRSRTHRRLLSELPGYDARETGELTRI